jgi:hypothetical protein
METNETFTSISPSGHILRFKPIRAWSVACLGGSDISGDLIIPGVVKTPEGKSYIVSDLGKEAFLECSGLESVVLMDGVVRLGDECFGGCNHLRRIEICKSLEQMPNSSFSGCNRIEEIVVAEGNRWFTSGNGANCVMEKETKAIVVGCVNTDLTQAKSIKAFAFYSFLLEDLYIPASIDSIEPCAFAGCVNLKSIRIDPDNTHYYDGGCNAVMTRVTNYIVVGCKNTTFDMDVPYIQDMAFFGCNMPAHVELPYNLLVIGRAAFSNCHTLEGIEFPDGLRFIGEEAFTASGLREVTIPGTVENIRDSAFQQCTELRSVVLEEGIQKLGGWLFSNCPFLHELKIPASVEHIDSRAFHSWYCLCRVTVDGANERYEDRGCNGVYDKVENKLVAACVGTEIAFGTEVIGHSCFGPTIRRDTIEIPETVEVIEDFAFFLAEFKHLVVPDSVRTIGCYAFGRELKWVSFGEEPPEIAGLNDETAPVCPAETVYVPEGSVGRWLEKYHGWAGHVVELPIEG